MCHLSDERQEHGCHAMPASLPLQGMRRRTSSTQPQMPRLPRTDRSTRRRTSQLRFSPTGHVMRSTPEGPRHGEAYVRETETLSGGETHWVGRRESGAPAMIVAPSSKKIERGAICEGNEKFLRRSHLEHNPNQSVTKETNSTKKKKTVQHRDGRVSERKEECVKDSALESHNG